MTTEDVKRVGNPDDWRFSFVGVFGTKARFDTQYRSNCGKSCRWRDMKRIFLADEGFYRHLESNSRICWITASELIKEYECYEKSQRAPIASAP